jgi:hypothetical protein
MRFPQVTDRVKEAPAHALRAMFAGIGQVLLVADRMRSRPAGPDAAQLTAAEQHDTPVKATPAPSSPEPAPPRDESRWRSLDQTGNVRILPVAYQPRPPAEAEPAELAPAEAIVAEPAAPELLIAEPAEAGPVIAEPVAPEPADADTGPIIAEPVIAEPVAPEPADADTGPIIAEPPAAEPPLAGPAEPVVLPVPHYGDLSVASLRARLRNLDSGQVQVLLAHEKAHAARPAVLTMFERRITKLGEGEG